MMLCSVSDLRSIVARLLQMGGRTYVPYCWFKTAFPRWGKDLHMVESRVPSERAAYSRWE